MLKQARYFQTVVRCGSFSKAAEECFISQSAISQQVQALEKELGVELLHREGRRFSLTPAGELFYQKSLALTAEWDKLCREVCQVDNEGKANLRVGCLRSFAGPEFRWALQSFAERYPSVELHLTTGSHEDLYSLLISGQVDLLLSDQRHTERAYYRDIIGLQGKLLYAGSLEEARLLAVSGKGFLLLEGAALGQCGQALRRVPLLRYGKHLLHNYCAFWSRDNSGYYVEEFAGILKKQFEKSE